MIIKNLWVINSSGLCVYSYKANFSDYSLDETMFGGFISALASFTETQGFTNIKNLADAAAADFFRKHPWRQTRRN